MEVLTPLPPAMTASTTNTAPSYGAMDRNTQTTEVLFQSLEVDPAECRKHAPAGHNSPRLRPTTMMSINRGTLPTADEWRHQEHETLKLPEKSELHNQVDLEELPWRTVYNGGLHISPYPKSPYHSVLDIGTGPGSWAIEYAEAHPQSRVIAADLILHHKKNHPANCHFVETNVHQEWDFDQKFHFIHSRDLFTGMKDWPNFLANAYQHLHPGGYLELAEPQFPLSYIDDGSAKTNSPLFVWSQFVKLAAQQIGIDTLITLQMERLLKEAGFVNVRVEWSRLPAGTWAKGELEKDMGRRVLGNTSKLLRPLAQMLWTHGLGWREQQVDGFLCEVNRDLEAGCGHYFWQFGIFSAQKPE